MTLLYDKYSTVVDNTVLYMVDLIITFPSVICTFTVSIIQICVIIVSIIEFVSRFSTTSNM